jgi:hypothetical protein
VEEELEEGEVAEPIRLFECGQQPVAPSAVVLCGRHRAPTPCLLVLPSGRRP